MTNIQWYYNHKYIFLTLKDPGGRYISKNLPNDLPWVTVEGGLLYTYGSGYGLLSRK